MPGPSSADMVDCNRLVTEVEKNHGKIWRIYNYLPGLIGETYLDMDSMAAIVIFSENIMQC